MVAGGMVAVLEGRVGAGRVVDRLEVGVVVGSLIGDAGVRVL